MNCESLLPYFAYFFTAIILHYKSQRPLLFRHDILGINRFSFLFQLRILQRGVAAGVFSC